MTIGINFFGPIHTEDGIGEAARLTLKCFQSLGLKIAINPLPRPVARGGEEKETNISMPYDINYFHFSSRWVEYYFDLIGYEVLSGKYNIAHWLTEVSNYPDNWAKNHVFFDEIWTASSFCQDSISMKIQIPTILIPYPILGAKKNNYVNSQLNFLVMANMYSDIERKNVLTAISAFLQAFPNEKNVHMVVKISNSDVDISYMNEIIKLIGADNRFTLMDEFISRKEVEELFCKADVYVSLHRAEGFGLTLGEAMLQGTPVITTAYSGNMDFCNQFNCFLVEYDMVKVGEERLRYQADDVWAEPRLDSAIKMYKRVYENPIEVQKKVQEASKLIKTNFSTTAISKKIELRLKVINSQFKFETDL